MDVFVYGTLKPGGRYYPDYCEGKTLQEREVYTYGKLFHLPLGYPGLIEGDDRIKGILLTFADESVLESLDELEDYDPMRSPEQNEYERKRILVYSLDEQFLGEAWGYLMTIEKIQQYQGKFVISGCWTEQDY